MRNKLTKHDEKVLANFLRKHRNANALSLLQAKGFLFCLVCCPDSIAPSEWLPLILEDASFKNDEEAKQIMDCLLVLYNQMNNQILHGTAKLPKECHVLANTMSNFVDPAPIHQWSQGFMKGYVWLREFWDEIVKTDDDVRHAFDMNIIVLGVAADAHAFEVAFAKEMEQNSRLEMAKDMLAILPAAMKILARIGLSLREKPVNSLDGGGGGTLH